MLLYKLTADLLGERLAFWTVTFLSIAPTSFFFQAIYTESLFLLLSRRAVLLLPALPMAPGGTDGPACHPDT